MRITKCFFGLVMFIIFYSCNIFAHKVNIFAYIEGSKVYTESYFNDGRPSISSKVKVFGHKTGKLLCSGNTDKNGKFSFDIPRIVGLRIVLTAGLGHMGEYFLSEDEIKGVVGANKLLNNSIDENIKIKKTQPTRKNPKQIDNQQLEILLKQIVKKEVAPVKRKIFRIEKKMEKTSIREILGGLGYILGLMGVAIYFKYKNR